MKKSKLIKMLTEMTGDPDVILWNGMVGDWTNFRLVPSYLYKQTLEDYLRRVAYERKQDMDDWDYELTEEEIEQAKKDYRKYVEWEVGNYVSVEDVEDELYKSKPVVFIEAKPSGKSTFDRFGIIEY